MLRGEDETLFHRELRDLSGGDLSAVSLLNTLWSSVQNYLCMNENYILRLLYSHNLISLNSLILQSNSVCLISVNS